MDEKPRVLIAATSALDEQIAMLRNAGCEVLVAEESLEESTDKLLPACHGVCLGIQKITEDLLQRCPHLIVVARHGVGTDNVDVEVATRLGIYVTRTPGANSNAVAEFTLGAVISLSRSIVEGDRRMKRGEWRHPSLWGWELSGKTMGIVGLGQVGQRTARFANAFGMEVLAHDPYQDDSIFNSARATRTDLDELVSRSQFLCVHTSLTKETQGLLDRRRLEMMPKGSYLINMARAEVVDGKVLKTLLDSGHIAGAALDVFEEEPPKNWELANHPNVLATPHIAAFSHEARKGMCLGAASEVITALRGQRPANAVNDPKSPRIRQLIEPQAVEALNRSKNMPKRVDPLARRCVMDKAHAWVILEPGKMELQEFAIPKIPDDGALLKVEACGVCGTDKHMFLGHMATASFPLVAGHEFIGTIVEIGKSANDKMIVVGEKPLKEGDRVSIAPSSTTCGHCWYCLHMPHRPLFCPNRMAYGFIPTKTPPGLFGAYADYVFLHPRTWAFKLPDGMSMERAVQTEPMATGLRAVERAYSPGEPFMAHGYGVGRSAMVLGTGPIGLMVIVALRASGAGLIIAQDLVQSRLDMAKRMGADITIDGKHPLEKRLRHVQDATDGMGPDVVIEAAGVPIAFQESLTFVRRGGKLIEVGHFTDPGTTEIHPWLICFKDVDIHGSWAYPAIIFKDALSLLSTTPMPVEQIVTHKLPLEDLPKAMELLGNEGVGKVVIQP